MNLSVYLLIGLGGALGSMLRAFISMTLNSQFPWATLLANFLGCLLIGLAIGHESATAEWAHHARGFVIFGFCGGFTTFSTFSLQTFKQLEAGNYSSAALNIGLSLLVCLVAVVAGVRVGKAIF